MCSEFNTLLGAVGRWVWDSNLWAPWVMVKALGCLPSVAAYWITEESKSWEEERKSPKIPHRVTLAWQEVGPLQMPLQEGNAWSSLCPQSCLDFCFAAQPPQKQYE